ncbi:NC domain protein, partial [Citrobacter sp. AAK_AS5]
NNCEHFAEWCTTGQAESSQVRRAIRFAGTVCIAAGAVAITAVGTGLAVRAKRRKDARDGR